MTESDPFAPVPDQKNTSSPGEGEGAEGLIPPSAPTITPPLPSQPQTTTISVPETFHSVISGEVWECKLESGVMVKLNKVGSMRELVRDAIGSAAFATGRERTPEELAKMTHMERAAYHLARSAGEGDLEAFESLLDRLIGKPKQVSESFTAKMTIDDVLSAKPTEYEQVEE